MTSINQETDRRHFNRVHFESQATLSQTNIQALVDVVDLSLNGVLIDALDYERFDLSKPLQLTLSLADNAAIEMDIHCVHQSDCPNSNSDNGPSETMDTGLKKRCGFCCDSIDVESITHLRRLVELNLGNPNALDRDLSEMLGPH